MGVGWAHRAAEDFADSQMLGTIPAGTSLGLAPCVEASLRRFSEAYDTFGDAGSLVGCRCAEGVVYATVAAETRVATSQSVSQRTNNIRKRSVAACRSIGQKACGKVRVRSGSAHSAYTVAEAEVLTANATGWEWHMPWLLVFFSLLLCRLRRSEHWQ